MSKIATTILILILALTSSVALADGSDAASGMIRVFDEASQPKKTTETPAESGTSASEVLRGNGSRAGYLLGHGNIIAGSEWVFIGVKRGRPNADYTIDYGSGSLFFAEPVRTMDSIKVDYRYLETGKGGERSMAAPGALPFRIGSNLQTNLVYSYRAADPSKGGAQDVLTYGMNTTTTLGNASSITSMMYMATPQNSGRLSLTGTQTTPTPAPAKAPAVKKDRMMVQDADLGLGKLRLKLGLQDVGEDFAGFASLRDSRAAAADVLNRLDAEKGLKRTNLGAEFATGKNSGLSFYSGTIKDKNDSIQTQRFAYTADSVRLDFSTREIGKGFTRFKDLAEADKAQMAAEAGTRRTSYGMQLRTGMVGTNPIWSGMSFATIQSETGQLSYRSTELDLGNLRVEANVRTMDQGFSQMGALNDSERSQMALIARRQFSPKSQASEIVAADKAKFNSEAGLNRKNWSVAYGAGPVKTWLSLSDVDSTNGGLSRRDINIEGKNFSVFLNHHRIDEKFDRLSSMQPIELLNYGNEAGMNRTATGANLKLGFGDLAVTHGNVTDYQGASVKRQSLDFTNTMLKFHANFQDIDPRFSRIMDLSDTDRKMLVQERGFKRSDYAINLQATPDVNIDSYIYNSTNVTANQARSQNRHRIVYKPQTGPQVTALMDDFSYISDAGNLSSYTHSKITFDNKFNVLGGLLFRGLNDANTTQEQSADAVTTQVTQLHLETDQNAQNAYTLDTVNTDFGNDGRFENSWDMGVKTKISKSLSLAGGYTNTAREADNSETSGRIGFDWSLKNDLSLSFRLANRDGGPKGSQQSRQFSMKGVLAKRFLMFSDVSVDSGVNSTELKGKQVGCDNGLRLNAGALGGKITFDNSDKLNPKTGIYHTSRLMQYESDSDPAQPGLSSKKPYHLTLFKQDLITAAGLPAQKRNYTLNTRLTANTGFTLCSFFGKDGQNGVVLPVGGTVFKLTHALSPKTNLVADYTTDLNDATFRQARTIGLGVMGTLPNNSSYEVYYGWSRLLEGGPSQHDNVFRLKYEHKVDAEHSLSINAQKKSVVDKSSINPFEGDTTIRIEFKSVFN